MPVHIKKLLKELKEGFFHIYGEQLKSVYLYGSYARGDNVEGSDLDVLVVLNDFQRRAEEIRRTSELIGDISLNFEVTVSTFFVRQKEWQTNEFSLLRNVKAEGVVI